MPVKPDDSQARGASVRATVARGRTLHVNGVNVGPGSEVTLPTDEATRLRQLGYLVDPGVAPIAAAEGPNFGSADPSRIEAQP